ncbi:MAG TPA: hypothetical protein VG737_13875 [Cyclobacteriaceae bacterium]|nr:hypothetical protein [Cyclobacteriaceae bacterium]
MNFFRAISNLLRFDRTNWKALTLCAVAASVFWIFNALNKEYSTDLKFPLQFDFDNTKYIPVDPLPGTLTLNVKGIGWNLLRKRLGYKVQHIIVGIERPEETKKISGAALAPVAAGQIAPLLVNFSVTDTLRFKIESRVSRRVGLVASLDGISYKPGLGRTSAIAILPDSISVEGPKSIIDSLADPVVLHVNGDRIDANFRGNVEVDLAQKHLIRRNPPVAEVMFEVGPVEEVVRQVKLKVARAPWGTEFDKDSVRCVFQVPQKDLQRFPTDLASTFLTFEFGEMQRGEIRSYLPEIYDVPPYAEVLHIDSIKVKKY